MGCVVSAGRSAMSLYPILVALSLDSEVDDVQVQVLVLRGK